MSDLRTQVTFKVKKVSLADLTPEQRIFAVKKANETGQPIEEIIQDIKENEQE